MDRDYWRAEPTKRLIEEARTKGCELCRAIGERLEDADNDIENRVAEAVERAEDSEREANQLDDKIYELRLEIDKLNMMIDQRDAEIKKLKGKK